ncbi:hypothetical protein JK386_10120 [Nocardioides sp. zg-536]|uniref:Uncharacterized protein n=1 Tax=Nocardioides faecalis TaxID=2803858 RepID=A0A938Y6T4_9ACTN|nr:hypothetical protein [Nocardioides faecalis]MBM9460259.1 hypothetical protein [Nocardioides faecalis]QVI59955.1 hypothetical protein KG111_06485 [Nocardioides faecalis]
MTSISIDNVPRTVDGPSVVAAASALMLLPENASRHLRLHRMAALGMALGDRQISAASASAVRALLKRDDIGGPDVLREEDPYSDVLVQSIDFAGGPYLVSSGSGDHTVADVKNLIDAMLRERWMDIDLYQPAFRMVHTLLIVSDLVLRRAGLRRGTLPLGSARTPVDVPGAARLRELASAAFISNDDLDSYGPWFRMVIDTFALDPGTLTEPCGDEITDDRLHMYPFLRLADGYRVVLPLDLLVTMRFHFLRFAKQAGQLEELGRRWRTAALYRVMRLLDRDRTAILLEEDDLVSRYLLPIDDRRDLHVVLATDPLTNWDTNVWGHLHDTQAVLARLAHLIAPEERRTYSSASTLLHLVISDNPGGAAFWGVPNINDADPMLIVRSDDLEVMLHHEPDGALGLLLFAEAQDRRPGEAFVTDILDEFSVYKASEKSFYVSDGPPPNFTLFQTGEALAPRAKYQLEVDLHGVVPPREPQIIVPAQRRYRSDGHGIYIVDPRSPFRGYVVELTDSSVFITVDLDEHGPIGVEANLVECAAYWVWECANRVGVLPADPTVEIVLKLSSPESWRRSSDWSQSDPAVRVSPRAGGFDFEITETFVALLQEGDNVAERELVSALLEGLFAVVVADLPGTLDPVAPSGSKRMLNAFDQSQAPDMWAKGLPRPLTGHSQVVAQLLDDLGDWLRSPSGGNFPTGGLDGNDRVAALNAAVKYLFKRLESEIAEYEPHDLLAYLIAQNESLLHDAKFLGLMLRSRIACFGENSEAATDLVEERKASASAQRANRFLIEYVAARPPTGTEQVQTRDYYRLLSIASEIAERGTASDFLHHRLADFEVSILESGRLGVERGHPVHQAMQMYAENSGSRSLREAQADDSVEGSADESNRFDFAEFLATSAEATRAEFRFTFDDLREVCGGLLDLAAADQVNRVDRTRAIAEIARSRGLTQGTVKRVLDKITLVPRASFMSIGYDAVPWRFNRDMSYIRRPVVQQGTDLVFGFRTLYRLGPYWVENLLSGRLQGRAETDEMIKFISQARRRINDQFAQQVARKLDRLGFTIRLSVKKFGKNRVADPDGNDIGDIDVLAFHEVSNTLLAVEAKDFEIARTPVEIANEVEKLFTGKNGKRSTVELHSRRIDWLHDNIVMVTADLGLPASTHVRVLGAVVTSEPLLMPLVTESPFPVVAIDDLTADAVGVDAGRQRSRYRQSRGR